MDDRGIGRAGIEPDVHDVGLLGELLAAAVFALGALGQDVLRVGGVPGVRTPVRAKKLRDGGDARLVDMVFAAFFAVEDRDRNTPGALARDAPVAAVADHVDHAAAAPLGDEVDLFDLLHRLLLDVVDRAEPLLGGAVDDRLLAAPAVRVLVDDLLHREEVAGGFQLLGDRLVGGVGRKARELARELGQLAELIDRHDDFDLGIVLRADVEVLDAVAGRRVDAACAALERDVVAKDDRRLPVEEGMLVGDILEFLAQADAENLVILDLGRLHRRLDQLLGHDVIFPARLHDAVLKRRADADGHVAGQRPGGRGPDDDIGLGEILRAEAREHALLVVDDIEFHIDRTAGVLLVFDLRLGERRFALRAPVDRLEALIDIALVGHRAEDLDLARLVFGLQRQVGVVVVREGAQALEFLLLVLDETQREIAAHLPKFDRGDVARNAQLLNRLELDGQAVGVPAGGVGGLVSGQVFLANDDVLEHLVERGPEVDVRVRIRRAVVEHIERLALVLFDHLVVKALTIPFFDHAGLLLRQPGPHREVGLGKV